MAIIPTHVAYSDESYHTGFRYRSVAVVTLQATDDRNIGQIFEAVLKDSDVKEFKWEKLRQARERFAAIKMLDVLLELSTQGKLRVDTLIWATYDSRHSVQGRDDTANLQRMYYHLFKNVLQRRWPRDSAWRLHPDENTALDWLTVQDYLETAALNLRIDGDLFHSTFRLRLARDFRVADIGEACSEDTPLCQLADLCAGLGAFSHSAYNAYESWFCVQCGQPRLDFDFDETEPGVSNRERERFAVMRHLDEQCKKLKLGVGLRRSRGFKTYNPALPVNFWLYQPQHPADKAPTKS